ncbi:MAG TPA: MBL fold metallo-hydrolase [Methanomicrobiales archaeon]|jgi:phosphoribosyl 1,2-cyclic phosphodiesterase|nr:MBL fold metallo-hydrolase [Methanomicrobiales archaeon]
MRITVLASGSKGNCTYVDNGSGALLVDCGLSVREALARMQAAGSDPALVRAILLTHEHTDHILGAVAMARRLGVPVYGTGGTLLGLAGAETGRRPVQLVRIDPGSGCSIDGFAVDAFATSHDAREPCGYTIRSGDLRFTCCTDTGLIPGPVSRCLRDSDTIILESNHCPEMLRTGPYPESLKRRIRSRRGHLSNAAAASCLREIASDMGAVILGHLSETNNTPGKALASAREAFGFYLDGVEILVARQHEATPTLTL